MHRIVIYFAPVKVRSTVITMSLCLIVVTVSSKLLCQRPRAERHQFLCTDSARCQSAPCTRTVWRSTADGLPSCRRRLAAVCCQRLVGFHHGRRPQRIDGLLRRGVRAGYRRGDEPMAGRRLWRPTVAPRPVQHWPRPAAITASSSYWLTRLARSSSQLSDADLIHWLIVTLSLDSNLTTLIFTLCMYAYNLW